MTAFAATLSTDCWCLTGARCVASYRAVVCVPSQFITPAPPGTMAENRTHYNDVASITCNIDILNRDDSALLLAAV